MPRMQRTDAPAASEGPSIGPMRRRTATRTRDGLRFRLTLLTSLLLMLVGALLFVFSYVLVGRVVYALPRFPEGTDVVVDGEVFPADVYTNRVVSQGRDLVLLVGAITLPLLLIGGGAVAWILIGRALRPLATLTSAARGLSEASLDRRIALEGPQDEVVELADTFDEMLGRLQAAFEAERRFVANASHELRTPLSVIRTEVEVTLADRNARAAELREMAEVVLEATDRANRLLNALLVLARTQGSGVSERRPVELSELVEPALHAVDAEVRQRSIRVELDLAPAGVVGDRALLERVVGNLVENAVRHNVLGGELRVRTLVEDGRGVVEVSSGGTVIDPAVVSQLFEPFRQGERARTGQGGSGLGLSIVQAVVAAHDGTVTARAREAGGLTVRVELPAR